MREREREREERDRGERDREREEREEREKRERKDGGYIETTKTTILLTAAKSNGICPSWFFNRQSAPWRICNYYNNRIFIILIIFLL